MAAATRHLTTAFGLTAGAAILAFGVGAPPEHCPDADADEIRAAAGAATAWLVDNQQADGRWLYEYDRATDTASDGYNVVRHAGVMSSLYQAATHGIDGDVDPLASADRGLEWALDHLVRRGDWVGVTTTSSVQAGTNALLLSALVERRLLTGDDRYDDVVHGLGEFLVAQTEPSGALLAYYDLGPDEPRDGVYSIYYTGEAYWALGRLHRLEPDAGWGEVADRIGRYVATERDAAEEIWPPLADHWSGYALAETAAFPERPAGTPLTEAELTFARRQGALIGQRVRSISQRFGPWGPLVRGTFTPRGGGYGVFGEGLAGLWRTSQLDDRLADERSELAERTRCISGLAIEAQVTADEAQTYDDPTRVAGAWFIDDVTRMDDQQHALSALLFTVPIVEAAPYDPGHPAPSTLLWLIAVVGVVNPARALGLRRGPDGAEHPFGPLAGGAALGALVLLAVSTLSGPVLDAVGASRPAMRLAAGALCLLAAAVDLVRRRVPTDPATPAWLAGALFVARPALVVAGLGVVADLGLDGYLLALAVALVGTIAAVAMPPSAESSGAVAAATWSARLLSMAAVAASVLLIADAVFSI